MYTLTYDARIALWILADAAGAFVQSFQQFSDAVAFRDRLLADTTPPVVVTDVTTTTHRED